VIPLSMDDLKNFSAPSISRNPKIMYIFNQMELAEQRGIGMRDMERLPELGFPQPAFGLNAGMLEVTFGRTKEFMSKQAGLKNVKQQLTEEDKEALLFIQQREEVSRGEFATEFGLNDKTAQRRLSRLVERKLITVKGKAKAK